MGTDDARAALQASWNAGAQLVNFVGHGGVNQATAEGLLRATDMDLLTNEDRLPIVSALTCIVGRSDIPNLESLAEALVTDSDGGAIAVWAPTGVSFGGAAHNLNLHYHRRAESSRDGRGRHAAGQDRPRDADSLRRRGRLEPDARRLRHRRRSGRRLALAVRASRGAGQGRAERLAPLVSPAAGGAGARAAPALSTGRGPGTGRRPVTAGPLPRGSLAGQGWHGACSKTSPRALGALTEGGGALPPPGASPPPDPPRRALLGRRDLVL